MTTALTKDEMIAKLRRLYKKHLPSDATCEGRYWNDKRFAVKFSHPLWDSEYWFCAEFEGDLARAFKHFRDVKKWVLHEYRNRDGDSAG